MVTPMEAFQDTVGQQVSILDVGITVHSQGAQNTAQQAVDEIAEDTATLLADAIALGEYGVSEVISWIAEALAHGLSIGTDWINSGLNWLARLFEVPKDAILDWFDDQFGGTSGHLGGMAGDIAAGLGALIGVTEDGLFGAEDGITGWLENILNAISSLLDEPLAWFAERLEDLLTIPAVAFFRALALILPERE